ncbi:unnamed protein product, partial [Polarella glacialis]
ASASKWRELEDIWALLEDGLALIGDAGQAVTRTVRRWRQAAAAAAALRVKQFGEQVNALTSKVSDALASEDAGPSQGQNAVEKLTAVEKPPMSNSLASPAPPPKEAKEEVADTAGVEFERSPAVVVSEASSQAAGFQRGHQVKKAPGGTAVADSGATSSSSSSSSAPPPGPPLAWDELGLAEPKHSGPLQHARLLLLLASQQTELKVDKRSLAAQWLLVHHTAP